MIISKAMIIQCFEALSRKKSIPKNEESKLARVLTLLDLTGLGIGSTLGLGVYVLAGAVAKTVAGPAVCLSFLIAAVASAFAGLCYAEFAARVPRAGSAYVYSYVSVGEFVAFVIGWNLILEYVIGGASLARGLSNYIDALSNNAMRSLFRKNFPIDVQFLAPYPDFFAFILIIIMTGLLAVGVKTSTAFNNILTLLNLITVVTVLVAGSLKADPYNWEILKEDIPSNVENAGNGGFAPFGIAGIMAGAAKCFFGFVGFDAIATTGEEAKNPQRNIPTSIVISLIVIFFAYFGISIVLTMMWPYYDQNADAPFPYVFDRVGWPVIKWIVTIGAIFALCTSLMGAMFPLPRVLYAMGHDRVIFPFFARVYSKTKTPLIATIFSGVFGGIMAIIFDLHQLIDMMSIGTLLAYTIVGICVLVLRYEVPNEESIPAEIERDSSKITISRKLIKMFQIIFNLRVNKRPNYITSSIAKWTTCCYTCLSFVFCFLLKYGNGSINTDHPLYLAVLIILIILALICIFIISQQPSVAPQLSFKVPWVPLLPCLSILINVYLMSELDEYTWIRFLVWLCIGFIIYFLYGITHSREKRKPKNEEPQFAISIAVTENKPIASTNSSETSVTKC